MSDTTQERRQALLIRGLDEVSSFYQDIAEQCDVDLVDYNPLKDRRNRLLELYLGIEGPEVESLIERMRSKQFTESEIPAVFRAKPCAVFMDDDSLGEKSLGHYIQNMKQQGYSNAEAITNVFSDSNDSQGKTVFPSLIIPRMFTPPEEMRIEALQPLYFYVTKLEVNNLLVQELLKDHRFDGPGYSWVFYGENVTSEIVGKVVTRLYELRKQS